MLNQLPTETHTRRNTLGSVGLSRPPLLESKQRDAEATRPQSEHFANLSASEWRRRLLHMAPGLLPVILWFIRHHDPLSIDLRAILGCIIGGIGLVTTLQYHRIARRGEQSNPACILGYTIPIFTLLIFVPTHAELGFAVLAILSIGDGMATLGGLLIRGPKLPWNEEKSWAGLLCFIVFATPFAAVIYAGEAHPFVPFGTAFAMAAVAVVASAAIESIRSTINDNIRVGLTSAITLIAMQTFMIGWSN